MRTKAASLRGGEAARPGDREAASCTSSVRVLLTDLDDTLFDHRGATRAALVALREFESTLTCWPLEKLEQRHRELLEVYHLAVLDGRLSIEDARIGRFHQLMMESAGPCDRDSAVPVAGLYREAYERSWQPVPGARELLQLVRAEGIAIVVVTNNVVLEQQQKLERTGLTAYVDALITSEETGCRKPERAIFECALARVGAEPDEAVMLGDAWAADIEGARGVGVRAVWLNRFGLASPDPSVTELQSLHPAKEAASRLFVRT